MVRTKSQLLDRDRLGHGSCRILSELQSKLSHFET